MGPSRASVLESPTAEVQDLRNPSSSRTARCVAEARSRQHGRRLADTFRALVGLGAHILHIGLHTAQAERGRPRDCLLRFPGHPVGRLLEPSHDVCGLAELSREALQGCLCSTPNMFTWTNKDSSGFGQWERISCNRLLFDSNT